MREEDKRAAFHAFDPDAEVDVSCRNLPHWFQPGVAVFVTFRTLDSMPREAIALWEDEQREWLQRQGLALDLEAKLPDWRQLPASLKNPFRKLKERAFHQQLDNCHGACHLRQRALAEIVMNSIWHFAGDRYEIECATVMPNHVHLIAMFYPPVTCRQQCTSWQRFTAREINSCLGRKGEFWQGEPFDHLVRSAEQFAYLREYIRQNGVAAKLPSTDYLYRSR